LGPEFWAFENCLLWQCNSCCMHVFTALRQPAVGRCGSLFWYRTGLHHTIDSIASQAEIELCSRVCVSLLSGIQILDDIIVYSSDPQQHKKHLAEVFRRIRRANLRLN